MQGIDFKGLANELLGRSRELVPSWIPGGKMRGREYVAGSIQGGEGDSFSVNLDNGRFADFADSECRGGDLISLYSKIKGIKNGEAARQLAEGQGYDLTQEPPPPAPPEPQPELPPEEASCECIHPVHGEPIKKWEYKTAEGRLMFYVARYDTQEGKQICPWSFVEKEWKMKGWPTPRPLYGLETLVPNKPLLIVEGEKACDAARHLLSKYYNVITWPNGSQAWKRADWSPVYSWKSVLIWEDADQPGREASQGIAEMLSENGCKIVKLVDTTSFEEGWDAADAVFDGFDTFNIIQLLKPLSYEYKLTKPIVNSCIGENAELTKPIVNKNVNEPAVIKAETVNAENAIVQVNQYSSEDVPSESPESAVYWQDKLGLAMTKNGIVVNDMENGTRIISRHPMYAGKITFDTFYRRLEIRNDDGTFRAWEDEDMFFFMKFFQGTLGLRKYSDSDVMKAAKTVGFENKKNDPQDWMKSLVWDGTPRIETFFRDYYVAEDDEYSRAVSKNFWVGMVARIFEPGVKLDNMVILEGPQGSFKSTSLEVIASKPWYLNTDGNVDDKDFFILLRGKMLVEIAELDSFRKAENTIIKKILARGHDSYRDPYGVSGKDNPRTCVFVGTTNEDEYLRDNTGARRFWPIRIGSIYLDKIAHDREQLFAEAVKLYKDKTPWHQVPKELAEHVQEQRRISDPWEPIISAYLHGKFQVSTIEIATDCLKMEVHRLEGNNQKRIARIMRLFNWVHSQKRAGGQREYYWSSPDSFNAEEF